MRKPYFDVAQDVLKQDHPDARCAFIAGSITRNQGTSTSDIDLIVMYPDDFQEVGRHNIEHQGWPIEQFLHTEAAQNYYFQQDLNQGSPATLHMVGWGHVIGSDITYGLKRQELARRLFKAGPPPLTTKEKEARRYFITDKMEDLKSVEDPMERQAILADLYTTLIDFYLRANGHWSGSGKQLIRALKQVSPTMADHVTKAFTAGFTGQPKPILQLGQEILAPFSGPLWVGFYQKSPIECLDFTHNFNV